MEYGILCQISRVIETDYIIWTVFGFLWSNKEYNVCKIILQWKARPTAILPQQNEEQSAQHLVSVDPFKAVFCHFMHIILT